MRSFASALSEHPVTAHAVGEVVADVVEALGTGPDLAVLLVTPPHAGALEDAASVVRTVLAPTTLVGCASETVALDRREVEDDPAVALWAGRVGAVTPLRLRARPTPDGPELEGWPPPDPAAATAALVVADPFSFPVEAFLDVVADDVPIVGGFASAARGPGGSRLLLDGDVVTDGAVGVVLGRDAVAATVVSQGCRPVGSPFVVTRSSGNLLHELAGRPAMERLRELFDASSPSEQSLLSSGVHLGFVVDEHRAEFGPGDFLVRGILGVDRATGAIAVAGECEVGTTVQFHVRDASTADGDLRALLVDHAADAALLFTCNGRGTRLFGAPDHDAAVVHDALDGAPLAGIAAAGELGPVRGRNALHTFTASVLLLTARA